jgi:hypothetical protein
MTSRDKMNAGIQMIITTLAEHPEDAVPEGILYAALMGWMNFDEFNGVVRFLLIGLFVERLPGPVLKITDRGQELAKRLEAT